jgi:N-carbamoyl-L-amino-acid hydrolase
MSSINAERLLERIDLLAAISAPGPGVTRLAYSDEDAAAQELVGTWMQESGLAVSIDPVGNVLGQVSGGAAHGVLGLGSHLDSVIEAGPLDGAYGVVAAIEVANALQSRIGEATRGIVIAAFSNEEGARGSTPMIGSLAFVG